LAAGDVFRAKHQWPKWAWHAGSQLTFTVCSVEQVQQGARLTTVFSMPWPAMRCYLIILALAAAPVLAAGPSVVQELTAAGEILPFEVIRDRVKASVQGEYVGVEFHEQSRSYRFRFVNAGVLFNVDVDARTGARINRRQRF
jgi:hypothetical protein